MIVKKASLRMMTWVRTAKEVSMLNEGKIKQPKKETLEYYKIMKIGNKYNIIDID